jgi:EmrB/QacA subfamily drug resistance transporter
MSVNSPSGCDRSIAEAVPLAGVTGSAHPRLVLATTILASSLAFIDGSVVNVGLPAIGRSLGADGANLSWIVNGYLLPLSALLLLGGAAGDRFGRRRVLVIGVIAFALASLVCMWAPTLSLLVAGRVLQGIGAALLMPNSLALLGATFQGEERGRAIGTWAAVGAGAAAVAPLLGGWLIDGVGWRAIFLINLPIGALAVFLAMRYLDDEARPEQASLDIPGAALASIGLASLTWGLTAASGAEGARWAGATIAAGVVFLVLFLAAEKRAGEDAMLPLSLFASRTFSALNLLTFLLYAALGAVMVLVPFVLIEVKRYSATAAGAAMLPLPIVLAVGSSTMGRIAGKIGARLPLTLGPMVAAAGFLLAARVVSPGDYWSTTLPAMLVIALGMAGAVAPLTTAVLTAVDARHAGIAAGFNSAVARCGGLVATALLGSTLASHGPALAASYKVAAIIAAVAAFAAGCCALLWVPSEAAKDA